MPCKISLKKGLTKLALTGIILAGIIIPKNTNSEKKEIFSIEKSTITLEDNLNYVEKEKSNNFPFETVSEYDLFVRSIVKSYYESDIKEIYDFYNIENNFPKYGFKQKDKIYHTLDWTGAAYKTDKDSIYFFSTCPDELFEEYKKYYQTTTISLEDIEMKELSEKRIRHAIRHEAAHSAYFNLARKLNARYLFEPEDKNETRLEFLQHNLISEGFADYMAYKGKLTPSASKMTEENFKEMVENKNDFYLYDLGFVLVKSILDKNFEKGIEELIKNPLTKKDLYDLSGYRERIMQNISK